MENIYTTVKSLNEVERLKNIIDQRSFELIEIPQPSKSDTNFSHLVDFLLAQPNFNWTINDQPEKIISTLKDKLTIATKSKFESECNEFIKSVANIVNTMVQINPGSSHFGLRNFFCPGDSFFHLDNMGEGRGVRFLWAIGRPNGMKFTCRDNIEIDLYWKFIERELYLIRKMDQQVFKENLTIDDVWPHRPKQIEMMKSDNQYYVLDADKVFQVKPNYSSIHFIDTPDFPGTFHRNTFDNSLQPGLQILFTTLSK